MDPTDTEFIALLNIIAANKNGSESLPSQTSHLPIHFTIIRDEAGYSGWNDYQGNTQSLYSLVDYANVHFSPSQISFYICAVSYIYDDDLTDVSVNDFAKQQEIFNLSHRDDAINVYCKDGGGSFAPGLSSQPFSV